MAVLLYFTAATCANAASVVSLGLGYLAGLPQIALSLLAGATPTSRIRLRFGFSSGWNQGFRGHEGQWRVPNPL